MQTQIPPQTLSISHLSNVGEARRAAKTVAAALGFAPEVGEEIALAVMELATNLVKHTSGGTLILTPLNVGERTGLQVETDDLGPGIADVELALADGFSTAGSLGNGLGAVNRLMDEFDISSGRGLGTRIVCHKWLRQSPPRIRTCPLAFGVATRSRTKNDLNGDAFVIKQWAESALVGVIDGLGHGQFAHRAAQAACQYVESHFDLPLEQIFLGAGRACIATRGVVMALARFDWGQDRLTFASVGNIEVRIFPSSRSFHFIIRRGIVGLNAPRPVVTESPWAAGNLMVLHSDGLNTHWSWEDFPGLTGQPADVAAQALLRKLAKEDDDATVVVVGRGAT
jgi:anti-sigma regulatory factor (Ser/Thr protein kinase)